ncbi:MAG: hypothetical protein DRN81_07285, partial [Thermoproteota archaeon]
MKPPKLNHSDLWAVKYRIYPNRDQRRRLDKSFAGVRYVYNYFLERRIKYYEEHKNDDGKKGLNFYDTTKELTKLKRKETWLYDVSNEALQKSLLDLNTAYKNFFKKNARFPRFKSRYDKQSIWTSHWSGIKIENGKVYFTKFRDGIEIRQHREIKGEIRSAVISKSKTGKYYISITCNTDIEPLPETEGEIGIDVGVKTFATCSNGDRYENQRVFNKYLRKLQYEYRQLSKKKKGSRHFREQKLRVAKLHEKIANIRNDYLHKITWEIVSNNQFIAVEDLDIKNMVSRDRKDKKNMYNKQKQAIARSILDCGWGEFFRQLEYKSKWYGRKFVKIPRYEKSSKTCSICGNIKEDLSIDDRYWICNNCGSVLDRDWNASRNILQTALSGCKPQSDIKQKDLEAPAAAGSVKGQPQAYGEVAADDLVLLAKLLGGVEEEKGVDELDKKISKLVSVWYELISDYRKERDCHFT